MIPKVIHYCWFGGNPLPELAVKCINSWKKYLPDYEIKEWNEENFDVNLIPYTSEAYKAKKFAFVSDYARFWILYKYGGVYFDTDVEVLKPLDEIIERGPFMGCEKDSEKGETIPRVAPGLGLGVNPGLGLYKEFLDKYSGLSFINADGSYNVVTIVQYTTDILCKHGLQQTDKIQLVEGVYIYPKKYFNPYNFDTGCFEVSQDTYTIHHYAASWTTKRSRINRLIYQTLVRIFGVKLFKIIGL